MRALMARFLRDEVGATAIEYAIIAGGISIVIVAGVRGIGTGRHFPDSVIPIQRAQHRDAREHQPAGTLFRRIDQMLDRDLPARLLLGVFR
jgi:pilus assembly protein Flp/PilA